MRNPDRIPQVLHALQKVWEKSPDLRLGQLLVNTTQSFNKNLDVFYLEDDVLLRLLQAAESEDKEKMIEFETTYTLSLRDIASWQFPALAANNHGERRPPPVLAGLPSLQRGAVWRPNQVELLWDSILRGFPIGSLVVSPLLERQITRTGAHAGDLPWGNLEYTHHLLDGQQRANAIALGHLDPDEHANSETLLWLDLTPQGTGFDSSTRSHLLRVTTKAHPWGFEVSDNEPRRLQHREAQKAKAAFLGSQDNTHARPLPSQGWPIHANAPIPLAWALEAAHHISNQPAALSANEAQERALWDKVRERFANDAPQVTAKDDDRFTPWRPRALCVLNHWLDATTLPPQAGHLARALLRAMRARMVALPIDPEALKAPYRPTENSAQEENVPIANVEHLFQRLNGGGTNLSNEDRAYSMIKAYWPGIEGTIQSIKPRPPETQVALLGTRLGLDLAQAQQAESKTALPTQPSVNSLRQLATAQADGSKKADELLAQRQQIRTMFGLSDTESANDPPIKKAIEQWDRWFLYSEDKNWGLPPVLRSRMASQAPEVFLFLLRLAHHATSTPDAPAPSEDTLKKLLGLTTALHWFGLDREKAVRWLWAVPPAKWLDGSAFTNVLRDIRYAGQTPNSDSKPAIARILRPSELESYIDLKTIKPDDITIKPDRIGQWRWWNSLVEEPAHKKKRESNPQPSQKELDAAVTARWAEYKDFISILNRSNHTGTNALLLMYAQRDQMQHFFSDYDPQDTDFWAMHNVPWDFDHLLQKDAFDEKRGGFAPVCKQWGNTIANLHLLPFEQNRSRKNDQLDSIPQLEDTAERVDFLRRMHITPDTANRLSAFSMSNNGIRAEGAQQRVTNFVLASRQRLLDLYQDWFDTLQIGSMLQADEGHENIF